MADNENSDFVANAAEQKVGRQLVASDGLVTNGLDATPIVGYSRFHSSAAKSGREGPDKTGLLT